MDFSTEYCVHYDYKLIMLVKFIINTHTHTPHTYIPPPLLLWRTVYLTFTGLIAYACYRPIMGLFTLLTLGPDDGSCTTCRVGGAGAGAHMKTHWLSKAPCRSDMHVPVHTPLSGESHVATPTVSEQRRTIPLCAGKEAETWNAGVLP